VGPRKFRALREAATPPPDGQRQSLAIPANCSTITPEEQHAWRQAVIDRLLPTDHTATG